MYYPEVLGEGGFGWFVRWRHGVSSVVPLVPRRVLFFARGEWKAEFSVIPEWGDDLGSEHERYVAEKVSRWCGDDEDEYEGGC